MAWHRPEARLWCRVPSVWAVIRAQKPVAGMPDTCDFASAPFLVPSGILCKPSCLHRPGARGGQRERLCTQTLSEPWPGGEQRPWGPAGWGRSVLKLPEALSASLSTDPSRQGPLSPQAPGARPRLPFWPRRGAGGVGFELKLNLDQRLRRPLEGSGRSSLSVDGRVPCREAEGRWAQHTPARASTLVPGRVSEPHGHQAGSSIFPEGSTRPVCPLDSLWPAPRHPQPTPRLAWRLCSPFEGSGGPGPAPARGRAGRGP